MKQLFSRILVALGGSEASIHAAMYAMIMAKSFHSALKIVFVVDTETTRTLALSKFFTADERFQYEARLSTDGDHYLTYVANMAKSKGIKVELELFKGAVWAEVLKAAEDFMADVIVLGGSDGKNKNGTSHSVSRKSYVQSAIMSNAACPVLVVKKPDIEKQFKAL